MRTQLRIAALILAAGSSSRMGAFKPLLPLGGSTAIELAVSRFRTAGVRDVKVVTGDQAEQLVPILAALGVEPVFNPDYNSGMLSSVQAGRNHFHSDFDAFFLLPVDIPLIKVSTIEALVREYDTSRATVIYPRFLAHRGHPPLISASVPIQQMAPDTPGGLRALLSEYERTAVDVDVADQAVVMDFDTPADYRKLQEYACREDIPTEAECRALWIQYGVPESIKVHSGMVAELARILAIRLNQAGLALNVDLVVSGGRLHDIAKGLANHAIAGAEMLRRRGYPRVAQIVANHTNLRRTGEQLSESDLVYLADKYIRRNQIVSLDERFRSKFERHANEPEILKNVTRRKYDAAIVAALIEKTLGSSMAHTIQRHRRGILAASVQGERTIYLLRHGAVLTQGNGKYFIGQSDVPLSPEGLEQARKLREDLRDVHLSAIFCSDLSRSVQTAEIIAEPHQLPCSIRNELREINLGEWDGLAFDVVRHRYPEQFAKRGLDIVNFRPPGGESFLDCTMRVLPVFYEIVQSVPGNLVIVGHAGINRIILCQVLGMNLDRLFELEQNYGSTNIIEFGESGYKLKILNDAAFYPERLN